MAITIMSESHSPTHPIHHPSNIHIHIHLPTTHHQPPFFPHPFPSLPNIPSFPFPSLSFSQHPSIHPSSKHGHELPRAKPQPPPPFFAQNILFIYIYIIIFFRSGVPRSVHSIPVYCQGVGVGERRGGKGDKSRVLIRFNCARLAWVGGKKV